MPINKLTKSPMPKIAPMGAFTVIYLISRSANCSGVSNNKSSGKSFFNVAKVSTLFEDPSLINAIIDVCPEVRSIRDATRGGIASVLNEVAEDSDVGVLLNEQSIPMRAEVTGVCEILGLDPLYLANEGKIVVVVPADQSEVVLQAMRNHEDGRDSVVIGKICDAPAGTVVMETLFGGRRVVDMLVGEQLPRIC